MIQLHWDNLKREMTQLSSDVEYYLESTKNSACNWHLCRPKLLPPSHWDNLLSFFGLFQLRWLIKKNRNIFITTFSLSMTLFSSLTQNKVV